MGDRVLVASGSALFAAELDDRSGAPGTLRRLTSREDLRPTCMAADPRHPGRAWCGTRRQGLLRTDDAGESWRTAGLEAEHVTAVTVPRPEGAPVWAGTEPSAVWRSDDGGETWAAVPGLTDLPSSPRWSFPPRPETHHVRWIEGHPLDPRRLWIAIEAGALVRTPDGGRTWWDRVPGGPLDTHEIAVHPARPDMLRIAAGDGWFESRDGGESWTTPMEGLDLTYLRSVAVDPGDPEVVLVSGASSARRAYAAGRSDGRLHRREGDGAWERVLQGWPSTPSTIAPLLHPGRRAGELWAADERGLHGSSDGGRSWGLRAGFVDPPSHLRGLALVSRGGSGRGAQPVPGRSASGRT